VIDLAVDQGHGKLNHLFYLIKVALHDTLLAPIGQSCKSVFFEKKKEKVAVNDQLGVSANGMAYFNKHACTEHRHCLVSSPVNRLSPLLTSIVDRHKLFIR
jgi:hypothetical protein